MSLVPRRLATPANCPVCGTAVPSGARSCPECGSDERTGWNEEDTRIDGLDLPEEACSHDEIAHENDRQPRHRPNGISAFWWVVGIVLLGIMAKLALGF